MNCKALLGVLAVFAGFTGSAGAMGPVDISAEASVASQYVWRGVALNEDPVFQPSVTVGLGGLSLNIWGNMDFTDYQDKKFNFTEVDYTLDYTVEFPLLSISAGAMRYQYADIPGYTPTTELYLGAESGLPGGASLKIYQDVDKGHGTYIEAGANHSLTLAPFASLDLSGALGWGSSEHNRFNYDIPGMDGALTNFTLSAALPIGLGEMVTVAPTFTWAACLNSDLRDAYDKNLTVFGLVASASF